MTPTLRPGTPDDTYVVFTICQRTMLDLSQRLGVMAISGGQDPDVMARLWERRRPLFEHLGRSAAAFWVAEADGQAVAYARSIMRDGMLELTEFFVLPGYQSAGIGRELLARAFPTAGARQRVIIATTDIRAVIRYLKSGVYARFPIYYFSRSPQARTLETDLSVQAAAGDDSSIAAFNQVDRAVLGHTREVDHRWLLQDRTGYLYYRGGAVIGYGYLGPSSGPFALLETRDFPAVLAHAEQHALDRGHDFGLEVPLIRTHFKNRRLCQGGARSLPCNQEF